MHQSFSIVSVESIVCKTRTTGQVHFCVFKFIFLHSSSDAFRIFIASSLFALINFWIFSEFSVESTNLGHLEMLDTERAANRQSENKMVWIGHQTSTDKIDRTQRKRKNIIFSGHQSTKEPNYFLLLVWQSVFVWSRV